MEHQTKPESSADSLYSVCQKLRDKVEAFLKEDVDADILRDVQAQLRISMGVVEEALERYRYGLLSAFAICLRDMNTLLTRLRA